MKNLDEVMKEFTRIWGGTDFSNTIAACDTEAMEKYMSKIETLSLPEQLHGNPGSSEEK